MSTKSPFRCFRIRMSRLTLFLRLRTRSISVRKDSESSRSWSILVRGSQAVVHPLCLPLSQVSRWTWIIVVLLVFGVALSLLRRVCGSVGIGESLEDMRPGTVDLQPGHTRLPSAFKGQVEPESRRFNPGSCPTIRRPKDSCRRVLRRGLDRINRLASTCSTRLVRRTSRLNY